MRKSNLILQAAVATAFGLSVGGCASVMHAGDFSVTVDPKSGAVALSDGKQYASVKGDVTHGADGSYVAHFEAQGVEAFQGQQIAASAVKEALDGAAKAAVSAAIAPYIPALVTGAGAVAASGGLGTAAVGAAAAVGAQKVLAPVAPAEKP